VLSSSTPTGLSERVDSTSCSCVASVIICDARRLPAARTGTELARQAFLIAAPYSTHLELTAKSVQNDAARLVSVTRRCEHVLYTPVIQKLQWLPVRRRVESKLACLVHQSLAGQTPTYLASDIQLTANTGRPQPRSACKSIRDCRSTHTRQLW